MLSLTSDLRRVPSYLREGSLTWKEHLYICAQLYRKYFPCAEDNTKQLTWSLVLWERDMVGIQIKVVTNV